MLNKDKVVYAAFCGSGKSTLCAKYPNKFAEVECWKYRDVSEFPSNYISEIERVSSLYANIFISTDPTVLCKLHASGYKVVLVYPDRGLKKEYAFRYTKRGSSPDFLKTLDEFWEEWLLELEDHKEYEKIVLKSGMFLEDVLLISKSTIACQQTAKGEVNHG